MSVVLLLITLGFGVLSMIMVRSLIGYVRAIKTLTTDNKCLEVQQDQLLTELELHQERITDLLATLSEPISRLEALSKISATDQNIEKILFAKNVEANKILQKLSRFIDQNCHTVSSKDIRPCEANIHNVISDIDALWRPNITRKNIKFTVYVDPELSSNLWFDPDIFRQSLNDLMAQAYNKTEQGRIHLHVVCEDIIDHHHRINVTLADTGCGFSRDEMAYITLASQVNRQEKKGRNTVNSQNMSLKDVMVMMGGDITIKSKLGRGSEVNFWIIAPDADHVGRSEKHLSVIAPSPFSETAMTSEKKLNSRSIFKNLKKKLAMSPKDAATGLSFDMTNTDQYKLVEITSETPLHPISDMKVSGKEGEEGVDTTQTSYAQISQLQDEADAIIHKNYKDVLGLDILVVEDTASNRQAIHALLDPLGPNIVFAYDGTEAISALETHIFDLILMDIHMPELNGVHAAKIIRETEQADHKIPIIAITADKTVKTRDEAMAVGIDVVLTKPVVMFELYEQMKSVTYKARQTEAELQQNNGVIDAVSSASLS